MNIFNLLGDYFTTPSGDYRFLGELVTFLNEAIMPITIVLITAAAVFGVAIGFMIMKAESSDKANEMKKRLFHLFLTVFCVVAGVWILGIVLSNLDTIIGAFRR